MESFPQDLLVGVFPLVFAINATQPQSDIKASDEIKVEGSDERPRRRDLRRGHFEKFLDAMAASLLDDGDDPNSSLFQPDEESSDDDDFLMDDRNNARRRSSRGIYPNFGGSGRQASRQRITSSTNNTSYAHALAMGQSFFERARIESYGSTHGFPPSKDPDGDKNLVHQLPNAIKAKDTERLSELFRKHPLNGILPAGWLEKQVHALPSVILVVCTVLADSEEQRSYDSHLFQTIEQLAYSLAPKRKCRIHVVGLVEDDVADDQAIQWSKAVRDRVEFSEENSNDDESSAIQVTMLRASDDLESIDAGLPPGPALKELHDAVRDSSFEYYQSEARRTKEKLHKLTGANNNKRGSPQPTPDEILPLVIRYCVKIGFLYEFQLKHEKSLKFLNEAYRHTCRYYEYLKWYKPDGEKMSDKTSDLTEDQPSHSVSNITGDGVEVELSLDINNGNTVALFKAVVPPPPADMIHQCRSVAEWLNLKLVSAGFSSRSEAGFMAASNQWRVHQHVFCGIESTLDVPEWLKWAFVSRQRLVFAQLVERHPFSSCADLDPENDELMAMCSPWRTSLSAAESLLRIAREIELVRDSLSGDVPDNDTDKLRGPFIGALDSGGLATILREEVKVAHRQKALEMVLKSVISFESELRRQKRGFFAEDSFMESSSSRSGARLHYLAGGIFLGMGRHEEAVPHLEKATKYAKGWRQLELSIRKMLIECYEKHVPSHSDPMANESSQALASMILDSYFNAEMSSTDLRRALGQFSTISGGGSLRWYRESFNDEDPDLPFTFEVTFPENIFATIGETVKANVSIKSNLDYAVHVNSLVLLSLAGELPITSNDLMRATNASEGTDGGIIIQRKFEITIATELVLPKDLSIIASDDSGNGGEMQGVAGKGSFAKSARPRTAGLTSAGGARLLSADQLSKENKVTQGWSLRFLGGKPLKCDGIRLAFYPVQVGASGGSEQVPVIELTIEKKKPRTAADIKRTPFEEENYIASAWSRPQRLPLTCGPRSLRVLGPQPHMVITNVTEASTDGKALEGTINRLLLKLEAGPSEHCTNIAFRVSCFSVLITPEGNTMRLVPEEDLSTEAETSVNMRDAKYRTPVLVSEDNTSDTSTQTDYGYSLPKGWKLAEAGQGFDGKLRVLKGGDSTYIQLDFFRPSLVVEDGSELGQINSSLCKTDFYITVSYRQERPTAKRGRSIVRGGRGRGSERGGTGAGRGRGRGRGRSFVSNSEEFSAAMDSSEQSDEAKASPEDVTLDYSGTIVWSRPMEASFRPGVGLAHPCGISHASNRTENTDANTDSDFVAVDGGRVSAKCSLHTQNASEELKAEISNIRFKPNDPESPLSVQLAPSLQDGKLKTDELYKAAVEDDYKCLASGSKLSVAYAVDVKLLAGETGVVRGQLGFIEVDWMPFPLQLPSDVTLPSLKRFNGHGPLRLDSPATMVFAGPRCDVQRAPFKSKVSVVPSSPKVAVPFEVSYSFENLTNIHQTLVLKIAATPKEDDSGLIFSGLVNGQIVLGPKEHQTVSYTVLATRPGKNSIPALSVSAKRYNTWVVHGQRGHPSPLYIFP